MNLPDKEIDLLRNECYQLSIKTSRFALLQVSLLAFVVFAFANAFKQIQIKGAPEKLGDVRTLAPITKVSDMDLGADPIQQFFLLNHLLGRPIKPISGQILPGQEESAQQVLRKYVSKDQTVPENQKQAMIGLQKKLAQEVQTMYGEAFSPEFTLGGAKIVFDLRNWVVLLFLLFLFSEVHLFILRKKQHLIQMVAAGRIRSFRTASPDTVATMDLLTFSENPLYTTPFTRYPDQLVEWFYLFTVGGLLIFVGIAAKPFWEKLEPDFIFLGSMFFVLATSHFISYYMHVSNRLEEQIRNLGLPSCFDTIWSRGTKWAWRIARYRIPRSLLSTGSCLTLLTLFMAVSMDACGNQQKGYEFVRGYFLSDRYAESAKPVWFPVLCETVRGGYTGMDWSKPPTIVGERLIRGHQFIGCSVYVLSLSLAAVTLFLVFVSFRYGRVLRGRQISWLLRLSSGLSLFLITDLYFVFVLPHMRVAILFIYWLFPMVLWFWFGFSKNRQAPQRGQLLRAVLRIVIAPLVIWTFVFYVALAALSLGGPSLGAGLLCLLAGCSFISFGYFQLDSTVTPPKPASV